MNHSTPSRMTEHVALTMRSMAGSYPFGRSATLRPWALSSCFAASGDSMFLPLRRFAAANKRIIDMASGPQCVATARVYAELGPDVDRFDTEVEAEVFELDVSLLAKGLHGRNHGVG